MELNLKSEFYTLKPPDYNNQLIEINELKFTYIINKTSIKNKFKIIFNFFKSKIFNLNYKSYNIFNKYKLHHYYTFILYNPSMSFSSTFFFKLYKTHIKLYYNVDILNYIFINNLFS